MTGLREMFEDLAEAPPPPSRVTGDDVYALGQRRRHRRTRIVRGAAVLAVTAVAAVAASVVNVMSPAPEPAGGGDPLPAGNINWAGAADARHLYAAVQACPDRSCHKMLVRLYASDDGGRGWTARGDATALVEATVVGASTLVATFAGKTETPMLSTDGGQSWTPALRRAPVRAVPPGGTLICWTDQGTGWCRPYVVDPAAGWFAPLAKPPALAPDAQWLRAGDRLWAAGANASGQPAVAVSTNAGRSWVTKVLDCPRGECHPARVATTADGATAYAIVTAPHTRIVYRGGVTGGWTRMSTETTTEEKPVGGERSFVTADGTHVLYEVEPVGAIDGLSFWANSGPETAYRRLAMDGLPATVHRIRRAPDGWLFTWSYGTQRAMYGSTDGRHWSVIPSTLTKE